MGIPEESTFPRITKPDAPRRSGAPCKEPAACQPLTVVDDVVGCSIEIPEPTEKTAEGFGASYRTGEIVSREFDDIREIGMRCDGGGEGILNHPVNFGIRKRTAKTDQYGNGSTNITQSARPNEADSFGRRIRIRHGHGMCTSFTHRRQRYGQFERKATEDFEPNLNDTKLLRFRVLRQIVGEIRQFIDRIRKEIDTATNSGGNVS